MPLIIGHTIVEDDICEVDGLDVAIVVSGIGMIAMCFGSMMSSLVGWSLGKERLYSRFIINAHFN